MKNLLVESVKIQELKLATEIWPNSPRNYHRTGVAPHEEFVHKHAFISIFQHDIDYSGAIKWLT